MKKCKDCLQILPILDFSLANNRKSINSYCKKCANLRAKKYFKNLSPSKKEKKLEYIRQWTKKNLPLILEKRKQKRRLGLNIKERLFFRKRNKINFKYKLTSNLRHRIYMALKGKVKSKTTMSLLGCSIDFLKKELEKKFLEGMTWENYGKWHIDHIKPCAAFDLNDLKQQAECFHYSNLQPLWAIDNIKKGGNYVLV